MMLGAIGLGTAIAGGIALSDYSAEPVLWVTMVFVAGYIITS